MGLSGKQTHVLANLERVNTRQPTSDTKDRRLRYMLDDCDCTLQINALVVWKFAAFGFDGLVRLQPTPRASASPSQASAARP